MKQGNARKDIQGGTEPVIGCQIRYDLNDNQTIPSLADTKLTLRRIVYDPAGMADTANDRVVIVEDGYYSISALLVPDITMDVPNEPSSNEYYARIVKNGSTEIARTTLLSQVTTSLGRLGGDVLVAPYRCVVGDYFEIFVYNGRPATPKLLYAVDANSDKALEVYKLY